MAILVYRVIIGSVLPLCCLGALQEGIFRADLQFQNRVLLGGTSAACDQTSSYVTRAVECAEKCMEWSDCGYFFHSKTASACSLCSALHCRNVTMQEAPGYKLFLGNKADPADALPSNATNLCSSAQQQPLGCWKLVDTNTNGKRIVSVGPAGVWGLSKTSSKADSIYYRAGTYGNLKAAGSSWVKIDGHLKHLDSGPKVMAGVNNGNLIWRRTGITSAAQGGTSWESASSGYTWITVSPDTGSLWAVNSNGKLLHARDTVNSLTSGTTWDVTASDMKSVDAGRAGVWALDTSGRLYCRLGTYGDPGGSGTEWTSVSPGATFVSVSSGTHMVVAVTSGGNNIWFRTGLGQQTPTGLAWVRYPGVMGRVDVYESGNVTSLWALSVDSVGVYFSVLEF